MGPETAAGPGTMAHPSAVFWVGVIQACWHAPAGKARLYLKKDHLTLARAVQERYGGHLSVGARITLAFSDRDALSLQMAPHMDGASNASEWLRGYSVAIAANTPTRVRMSLKGNPDILRRIRAALVQRHPDVRITGTDTCLDVAHGPSRRTVLHRWLAFPAPPEMTVAEANARAAANIVSNPNDPMAPAVRSVFTLDLGPRRAKTSLDGIGWMAAPLVWGSERLAAIATAWLSVPDNLMSVLTDGWEREPTDRDDDDDDDDVGNDRPPACACEVMVANLIAQCIVYRPCMCFLTKKTSQVTYISSVTSNGMRSAASMEKKLFAKNALRLLVPLVETACRAALGVRIPMLVRGHRGVWIGPDVGEVAPGTIEDVVFGSGTVTESERAVCARAVLRDLDADVTIKGKSFSMRDLLCAGAESKLPSPASVRRAMHNVISAVATCTTGQKRPEWFEEEIVEKQPVVTSLPGHRRERPPPGSMEIWKTRSNSMNF